jgi:hypothetical protein
MTLFIQKFKQTALMVRWAILGILSIASLSLAQDYPWTFKQNMPTARGFLSGTVVFGKIYVIGGAPTTQLSATSLVEMYDPSTDNWTTMASIPEGRCAHATCTYKGKIYVFGGAAPMLNSATKNNVYEYDPLTNTWTRKSDMPYAIASCATAVVNDTIYLMGGGGVYWPPVSTVMAYHPLTESWLEKKSMSTPRGDLSACVVDGKIYAIGGTTRDFNTVAYQLVEVFDPATNTWTTKRDMPTGRFGLGTCVMEGKIYAVGGWRGSTVLTTNEMYDPVADTWESKTGLQERRFLHCLGAVGNKIYAIGGAYPNPQNTSLPVLLSSVEEYDAAVTSIASNAAINPTHFTLYQNYPNPFNPETNISYSIAKPDRVIIKIYDILGKEVHCLVDKFQNPGTYNVIFNAKNLSSGMYLYKMQVGKEVTAKKKMILIP